jgi:hypothetical protein
MAVTLTRAYNGSPAGTVVELTAELEAALIAQGLGITALATAITTGAQSSNLYGGTAAVPIAAASVVITNPLITPNTKMWAVVSQAAADGTFLRVERVVCAAGSATIYGTAAATAITYVDWAILPTVGSTPVQ